MDKRFHLELKTGHQLIPWIKRFYESILERCNCSKSINFEINRIINKRFIFRVKTWISDFCQIFSLFTTLNPLRTKLWVNNYQACKQQLASLLLRGVMNLFLQVKAQGERFAEHRGQEDI